MIYRSMCAMCVHLSEEDATCTAFPQGIPDEIRRKGFDHRNEFPGDGGIRFTPDGPVDQDEIDKAVSVNLP